MVKFSPLDRYILVELEKQGVPGPSYDRYIMIVLFNFISTCYICMGKNFKLKYNVTTDICFQMYSYKSLLQEFLTLLRYTSYMVLWTDSIMWFVCFNDGETTCKLIDIHILMV